MQRPERRPTIMTLEEVAYFLRLNKSTVYRMARDGTLPAWKLGNVWRFKKEAIEGWIATASRLSKRGAGGGPKGGMRGRPVIVPSPRKEPFVPFGLSIPNLGFKLVYNEVSE